MDSIRASMTQESRPAQVFFAGAKATVPLIIGAIPFGILFGTLGNSSGLSVWGILAMSLFVYAGAAQFIALGLLASGADPLIVIATTLVVNLRHILYSAAMVEQVKYLPQSWRMLMAFGLTDETFAATADYRRSHPNSPLLRWFYLGSMLAMYGNWQLCTWLGIGLGQAFPDMTHWGLDFAMSVTFIGMVAPYMRSRPMWLCLLTAILLSLVTWQMPHKLGLMISASGAIALGYSAYLCQRQRRGT